MICRRELTIYRTAHHELATCAWSSRGWVHGILEQPRDDLGWGRGAVVSVRVREREGSGSVVDDLAAV